MTLYVARYGGLALFVLAVAVGVLIGRVIEAGAVGLILFTIWSYVSRLSVPPNSGPRRR